MLREGIQRFLSGWQWEPPPPPSIPLLPLPPPRGPRTGRPRPLSCKTRLRGWARVEEPTRADWSLETHLFPDSPRHMDGCLLTCSKKYQELSRQRRECLQRGKVVCCLFKTRTERKKRREKESERSLSPRLKPFQKIIITIIGGGRIGQKRREALFLILIPVSLFLSLSLFFPQIILRLIFLAEPCARDTPARLPSSSPPARGPPKSRPGRGSAVAGGPGPRTAPACTT